MSSKTVVTEKIRKVVFLIKKTMKSEMTRMVPYEEDDRDGEDWNGCLHCKKS